MMRLELGLMLKQLLVFYLFISFILFTSAVPSSRSLKLSLEDTSSVPELAPHQEQLEGENVGEGFLEGKMDFEKNDYPDPGPNRGHDPKVPGSA